MNPSFLQCSIPVFEGLLAKTDNRKLLDLLWILCVWQALAKLRLQTERTKRYLEVATRRLGQQLRRFRREVSKSYGVLPELPSDAEARFRREAKAAAEGRPLPKKRKKKRNIKDLNKVLNLCTSKLHALGDYASLIFTLGPSDNYSTQLVRHCHLALSWPNH